MERTNFCIFLFLAFLSLLCNSEDYKYDDYKYNEYNYDDENYYYHNKKSEDYTEELNDYYGHQNLLAPAPLPKPQSPTSHDCSMCLDFNYRTFVIRTRTLLKPVSLILSEFSEIEFFLNRTHFINRTYYSRNGAYLQAKIAG